MKIAKTHLGNDENRLQNGVFIQKKILLEATFKNFENSKLKILDIKSVAKLYGCKREKNKNYF